jgi:CubicO group peptidase (beta-lactamase class C family)
MRFVFCLSALFVMACAAPASEQTLDTRIDGLFAAYDVGGRPGYAIGIVRDGELIFAKGYGHADIEGKAPITPDTAFNLASLSKQMTAAAIALQVEAGQIGMDDHLAEHWPDLPDFMQDITVAHLVYMTSGLQEYYTLPSPRGGWASESRFTVEDAINAVLASGELQYTPGTRWTYSNINYQFLAELVAKRENMTFADYMQTALFEPLGMSHSWVDASLDMSRPYRAVSYVWDDETGGWRVAPRLSPHYGGSGAFSSLHDLVQWDNALYGEGFPGEGFRARMLSTRKFDHDKDNDAFGLVHGRYQGLKTIWYEGGDYGVSTYMVHLPERGETVICLSNFGNARCADKSRSVIDLLVAFE